VPHFAYGTTGETKQIEPPTVNLKPNHEMKIDLQQTIYNEVKSKESQESLKKIMPSATGGTFNN
jgi:hypothetical protein